MSQDFDAGRRGLILNASGLVFAGALSPLVVPDAALGKESKKKNANAEDAVTPPEDLMREHGVLDRVLLIYERLSRTSTQTVILIRRFSRRAPR